MACAILSSRSRTAVNRALATLLIAGSIYSGSMRVAMAAVVCTGADKPASPLLSQAMDSPLYRLLLTRLGSPNACRISGDADTTSIVLTFPRGGTLAVSTSEIIETSTQEAVLPPSPAPLTQAAAIKVLREVERSSASPDGCGIVWSKLSGKASPTTGDMEMGGTVCNCKAHLRMKKDAVIGLGFSMAC